MNRLFAFSLLLICCVGIASAQERQAMDTALEMLLQDADLAHASIGVHVIDVETGSEVQAHQSNTSLVPASVTKLLTSGAALEVLGPDYRFQTQLFALGELKDDGVFEGDLLLKGGGDPTLGSKYFGQKSAVENVAAFNTWAASLKAEGIRKVTGQIIADASCLGRDLTPETWIWGDMGNYYGAAPSGLSIFDNTVVLQFQSAVAGVPTILKQTIPAVPGVRWENRVNAANIQSDQAYVFGAPRGEDRYVVGTIPANRSSFEVKAAMADPPKTAALMLQKALADAGIEVVQEPVVRYEPMRHDGALLTYTQQSEPLSKMVYYVNLKSVNLFAEHLALQLAKEQRLGYLSGDGAKVVQQFWEDKIQAKGLFLHDGSGLSRFDAISPQNLTAVLQYMSKSEHKAEYQRSLPVMGKSGSIASLGKGTAAAGNLRAKSGYMTRVRSYSGYVMDASGRELAFAVVVNNYSCSAGAMKRKLEKWMVSLAK